MENTDMKKSIEERIMCRLFYMYLRLLEKTVTVEWIHPENFQDGHVVGFWHEDSFAMNLVLKNITEKGQKVSVMVTGDKRGDYIQYMIEKCRGDALNIGQGFCNAGLLRDILRGLKEEKHSVAIAMDGPLGPRHIPKKTIFFLSEQSRKTLLGVTLEYSRKLRLTHRWDHYRVPLPFSKITVRFDDYGVTSCRNIPRVRIYQEEGECGILSTLKADSI